MEPIFFRLDCALKSHVHSSLQSTFVTLSGQQRTLEDLRNIFLKLEFLREIVPVLYLIDCCSKFATGLKCLNRHRSKNMWVTSLFFCQNGSLMGESLWQKNSLVTLILFELWLFWYLAQSQVLGNSLYDLCGKKIGTLRIILSGLSVHIQLQKYFFQCKECKRYN